MTTISQRDFETAMRTFENQQFDAAVGAFAEDGIFIDPHYPEPESRGHETIKGAFEWVFDHVIDNVDLTIQHFWMEELSCVAEVATRQVMKDGSEHEFSQVFVAEFNDTKHLTRLQAYLPYGPSTD